MADFVHLHNHSDFSLQDGAQTVQMLCDRCDDLGMDTIALTEHGNLFSMIPFYKSARKKGLKPILGCEVYVSITNHKEKKQVTTASGKKWGYHHLVLLVQNNIGYKNLIKLISIGYLDGFYYRPRIDKHLLKKYNEGLICTSGCLAGEVTDFASRGDIENARKAAIEYSEIFPDRYYLELQNHTIPEEAMAREILIKLSKELSIPLVATNDCHYSQEDHWEAHDVLFCLGTDKNRSDTNRVKYEPKQFYIKTVDEMAKLFSNTPDAIENTLKIAESCNVEIKMGEYHLPAFPIPANEMTTSDDPNVYLKKLCENGLQSRYSNITPLIQQRLDFELNVIKKMGFAGYFLITQDFVKYARDNNIPVGPGRGSAAGSLVAYCTGITSVDPIKYNLLFERFLNPERITLPDIDIDFCIEGREKVINYIKDQYGHESVAQIITFGTMKAKSVLRDVGRVLGLKYSDVDRIAKMVPNELKITLNKAEKMNPDLKNISNIDDTHKDLMNFSKVLEGMHRHASTHAAGVVITPGPLTDYVPLFKSPSTGDIATQLDMNSLENLGILKMDFLGLRNLTVIDKTIKMVEKNYNKKIDIEKIPLDDIVVYQMFAEARTTGVFQFESDGMREHLRALNPSSIQDLIAMNALYRPGPMANIPKFIARKNGQSPIDYIHPTLEPILKETYGIIVYQEQVMQISQIIGGFTLAQGDMLRRAMGKKKAEIMAAFKVDFVEGAMNNKINKKLAVEIFQLLEKFAKYGFNKSHSTAYALVAYQTAWLKSYYPAEFFAANLSSEMDNTDRIVNLLSSAKKNGLNILPPNINTSYSNFVALDNNNIAYGLAAVKNIGNKAASFISQYRIENGIYGTLFDLCRCDSRVINRKTMESLVMSGACDDLDGHRSQYFSAIDDAIKWGQKLNNENLSSQENIFSSDGYNPTISPPSMDNVPKWTDEECLNREKEILGFYLSGNPLGKYVDDLNEFTNISLSNIPEVKPDLIKIGGIIRNINTRYDKNNKPWAIVELNGETGKADIFVFNEKYEQYKDILIDDSCVFVQGSPSNREGDSQELKMIASYIVPLANVRERLSKCINILFDHNLNNENLLLKIKQIALNNNGSCHLIIHLRAENGNINRVKSSSVMIHPSREVMENLREIVGNKHVWIS